MFFRVALTGCICVLCGYAAGADRFPYPARVAEEETEVRSGPGDQFSATGMLGAGDDVEVFRHDPGGWCAIRPPEGSYSWVFGDELKPLSAELAEVAVEGAKAFVGCKSAKVRDVSHVSLRRGERVQVLESVQDGGTWYKIAPPAGEFRWVRRRLLEDPSKPREKPTPKADRKSAEAPQKNDERTPTALNDSKRDKDVVPAEVWRAGSADAFVPPERRRGSDAEPRRTDVGYPSVSTEPPATAAPKTGWVKPTSAPATESADRALPNADRAAARQPQHVVPATPLPSGEGHGDPTHLELDLLELSLSAMVCEPKERWAFDDLRERTKEILRQASAPVDRGRARRLLERMARFEDVQRKSLGWEARPVAGSLAPTVAAHRVGTPIGGSSAAVATSGATMMDRENSGAPQSAASEVAAPESSPVEDPHFDGTGRLVTLQKREQGDPQYMLVDERGVTRYFVTAAPGVNLRAYLDRTIGVTGGRSHHAPSGRPHVTAQRVTVLR